MKNSSKKQSPYIRAISKDQSLPLEKAALDLWLTDIGQGTRWILRPILQLFFSVLLHFVWFLKRLPLPQFQAHGFLQWMICWFCTHFIRVEANQLILRHFWCESNILNFLKNNSAECESIENVDLYPKIINDMKSASFIEHDQELFRIFSEMPSWDNKLKNNKNSEQLDWAGFKEIDMQAIKIKKRWTQFLDFESAHALFMCLFCLLLTKEQYRDAINGFNLDQSIAIRIGKMINEPEIVEYAYNKYPQYLVGPFNLSQRFLMHGFFTEYLYAKLLIIKNLNEENS